jgi:hypothetical protein
VNDGERPATADGEENDLAIEIEKIAAGLPGRAEPVGEE